MALAMCYSALKDGRRVVGLLDVEKHLKRE
jgi:hypothetical protein